jgi:hypothetical protein
VFEAAASNPEWDHVYRAAVLAANTSMRGVEVKHVRRRDVDLEKVWDVESATGKGVLHVTHSKNETSKRPIPLNRAAREALERMLKRADDLGHTDPNHYLWCANQHHKFDPTKPALKWDTAWRALRGAAGLPGFRFHDLRHTVVTDLLEAGEPEHVIEAITGHLSRRMLEHYYHLPNASRSSRFCGHCKSVAAALFRSTARKQRQLTACCRRQVGGRDPHHRLLFALAFPHRHAQSVVRDQLNSALQWKGNAYEPVKMATCRTNADRFGHSCVSSACGPCHAPAMETEHPEDMG